MPTRSAYSTSMWLEPMLLVEMYLTPARLSARRAGFVTGVLWPTLTHRSPRARSTLSSDTAASVTVARTPKRGASSSNSAASSRAQP